MAAKELELGEVFRFFTEVSIVAQLARTAYAKAMPPDMTVPQFVVLHHLARLGGEWTPLRLANAMQLSKGAMTNTIGHLSRNGHVTIRPDERDRRSKFVSLTGKGLTTHNETIAAIAPELTALVDVVSGETLMKAIAPLEQVRKFLDDRRY